METPRRCMYLALWFAVVTVTAMPAWADGELDMSFGTNGVVKIDFPNSTHGYLRAAAVVNGAIEAAGFEPEKVWMPSGNAQRGFSGTPRGVGLACAGEHIPANQLH